MVWSTTGTQSGTDTSLAGLSSVTGVVVQNLGIYTKYIIPSTVDLAIDGTLSFNTGTQFEQIAFADNRVITVNGSLTIGVDQAENLQRYASQIPAIVQETNSIYDSILGGVAAFRASGVGVVNCYGQSIVLGGSFASSSETTINIKNTRIVCSVLRLEGNLNADFLDFWSKLNGNTSSFVVYRQQNITNLISRSESYLNVSAVSPPGTYNFFEIPALASGRKLIEAGFPTSPASNFIVNFYNLANGSNYSFDLVGHGSRWYTANLFKRVRVTVKNQSGAEIQEALIWLRGRSGATVYSATTNSSGTHAAFDVQLSQVVRNDTSGTVTYFSISNNTTDDFNIRVVRYGFGLGILPAQILKGLNNLSIDWTLFADPNITANKTTIDAKTIYTLTEDLYDTCQAWKADNFTQLYPSLDGLLCTANGSELDFGALNVVLDPTAAQARTVNTGTNTITFKISTTLTGKFTTLRTTGTITLQGGAQQGLLTLIDSSGTREPTATFNAPNINVGTNGETFDRVRCRLSRYFTYEFSSVDTTANTITIAGNTMPIGTQLMFVGEDLPQPLDRRAFYYTISAGNSFQISTTPGGAAVDLTDTGSGTRSLWGTFEIDNRIVTSGGYSQTMTGLADGEFGLFQAIHLKDSSVVGVNANEATASKYYEFVFQRNGLTVADLTRLENDEVHNAFAASLGTDGYSIRNAEFVVDPSNPALVQIDINDPDAQTTTDRAYLFYVYVQHTQLGLRAFRGYIVAINANTLEVRGELSVENTNLSTRLTIGGPLLYRADGKSWIAPTGGTIAHQPIGTRAVIERVEIPYIFPVGEQSKINAILAMAQSLTLRQGGGGGEGASAADVWSHPTRSLTDKANFSLSSASEDSIASKVWAVSTRTLTGFGTLVADIVSGVWGAATRSLTDKLNFTLASSEHTAIANASSSAVWNAADRTLTAIDKTGYSLTPAERTAIATAVEAALINEGDGQQLIDAILDVINANLDLPALELQAIAQAVRTELTTELARIDAAITTRSTQSSVNSIPTNPLLTTDARLNNLDAAVSTRSTPAQIASAQNTITTAIGNIPTNPLLTTDSRLNNLDAAISSRSTFNRSTESVTVGAIQDSAITAQSIAANAITAGKIDADAIGSSELAASAINEIVSAIESALSDDFANVTIDLTPVLTAIDALPTASEIDTQLADNFTAVLDAIANKSNPDNASISSILAKVNQIVIAGGKVEATIGNQTVTLRSSQAIQLLRLYQLFGFQYGAPVDHSQNYRELPGEWRVNLTEPSSGVVRLTREDEESIDVGGSSGNAADYERTFTNADLSIAGILLVNHYLSTYPSSVSIWDNNNESIWADEVLYVSPNQITINLETYQPIVGTWKVSIAA